jgi:hypothetical protein
MDAVPARGAVPGAQARPGVLLLWVVDVLLLLLFF